MYHLLFLLLLLGGLGADAINLGIGIGIGIGIGGGGSPANGGGGGGQYYPPAPSEPQQCEFVNEKQYKAYRVIQRFKRLITCDPKGITNSWVGPRICEYKGFACESPPNAPNTPTIAAVDFNGYQLAAPTVSGFIDQLPDLAFFHANTNNFSGTVPDLSRLPFIYEVDFSNNKLSGAYPAATANIPQLLFLDIRYNFFTGCVPPSAFDVRLDVLFLNNNGLSGTIPDNLGSTTAKYLTLANNKFTGPIPRSIGHAARTLVEAVLLNNQLSGCLPYEIGLLSKATVFDVGTNQLSGEIPRSFACLGKIEQLNLASNKLFGEVPDVVCRLPNVLNLSLSDNYFTSLGPSCYRLLEKGILDVRNNCIPGCPGQPQRSPEECEKFACSPKSCPVTPYRDLIPCKAPWCGGGGASPPPYARRKGLSVTPSAAYTAVREPES